MGRRFFLGISFILISLSAIDLHAGIAITPTVPTPLRIIEHESIPYLTADVVISPDGNFVYAFSNNSIYTYKRGPIGELDLVEFIDRFDNGITFLSLGYGIEISKDGNHLYSSSGIQRADNVIETGVIWFSIDKITGKLAYAGRLTSANGGELYSSLFHSEQGSMTMSPDGNFLHIGVNTDRFGAGAILVLKRALDGSLQFVQSANTDVNNEELLRYIDLAISHDGKHLYAISTRGQSRIYVYKRDLALGTLTSTQVIASQNLDPINGIPGLIYAKDIVVTGDGNYVYVVGQNSDDVVLPSLNDGNVVTFARNASDGSLTHIDSLNNANSSDFGTPNWDTLLWPKQLTLSADPDQKYLYVAARNSAAINLFERSSLDGGLHWSSWIIGERNEFGGMLELIASPDGRNLYCASGFGIAVIATPDCTIPGCDTIQCGEGGDGRIVQTQISGIDPFLPLMLIGALGGICKRRFPRIKSSNKSVVNR